MFLAKCDILWLGGSLALQGGKVCGFCMWYTFTVPCYGISLFLVGLQLSLISFHPFWIASILAFNFSLTDPISNRQASVTYRQVFIASQQASIFSRQAFVASQQDFISSSLATVLASSFPTMASRCLNAAMIICHVGSNLLMHNSPRPIT